jgi:hypothetical protein
MYPKRKSEWIRETGVSSVDDTEEEVSLEASEDL